MIDRENGYWTYIERWMDGWRDGRIDRENGYWIYREMDGWMDREMDG